MKIIDVNLLQEMIENDRRKIYYLLGLNIEKSNKKYYLFLKKMNLNSQKQSYQIARVSISNLNEQLKNGTEFSIQDQSIDDFILRDGITYETFADDGTTKQSYKFENVENLICLNYQGKTFLGKCFDDKNKNKKITYL